MQYSTVILLLLASSDFVVPKYSNSENETFVATNEWQEIREGQGIPAGLHVRINLQTGKKEAKILDKSEESDADIQEGVALAALPAENVSETPRKGTVKHKLKISKTLSDALKNLPKEAPALEFTPEKLEQIKRDYKSYKEIKESYDDLRKSFKTDAEMITQLLAEYTNITKGEQEPGGIVMTPQNKASAQLRVLDNLNYLVHQIDNALWFIDLGGLEHVLLPLVVNQTNVDLRVQALRMLGALTQNNPKAQIAAFERNFGAHLSKIIISSSNTEELSTALYAFGSLLRMFPHAQQHVLLVAGTQALVTLLGKPLELKVKAKAVTLINDFVVEQNHAKNEKKAAAAPNKEMDFAKSLQLVGYCATLDKLVSGELYVFLEQPDLLEYFTQAIEHTLTICTSKWSQSPQLRHTLLTLKNRYNQSKDEYRMELAAQIENLIQTLYSRQHEEL